MFNEQTKQLIAKYAEEGMTISELEYLGVPYRLISIIEEKLNLLYLKDLLMISKNQLLKTNHVGRQGLKQIYTALQKIHHFETLKHDWEFSTKSTYELIKQKPICGEFL